LSQAYDYLLIKEVVMKTYATKYLELAEKHAGEIAERWAKDVRGNHKTPFYKYLDEKKMISQCIRFYQHFGKMFVGEKIGADVLEYFRSYARDSFAMGIPMDEAVYALILMRRHIWLYADFQKIFTSGIDQMQAVETLTRTILLFDYAAYEITKEYQELMSKKNK
jgi:hypothetical protein